MFFMDLWMDATMIMLFMLFIVFSLPPLGAGPSSEADKPKEGICWNHIGDVVRYS